MTYSEAELEVAAAELFSGLGYEVSQGVEIHRDRREVVLRDDFTAFVAMNYQESKLSEEEIEAALQRLLLLPNLNLYEANKVAMNLYSDGFLLPRGDEGLLPIHFRYFNLQEPAKNIFRLVTQFEVQGTELRIPDSVVFVNGLPVAVIEYKSATSAKANLLDAFKQLTVRYKRDIPDLLKLNALCVVSDGANTKVGSLFSAYDHFYGWRKIEAHEKSASGVNALITLIKGMFAPERLIDVITNFIFLPDVSKSEEKFVCRYPQYFAARNLFDSICSKLRPLGDGRGGTYFGATGSGKSLTMVYLARLLMRSPLLKNPTILLITDRNDLDEQLSKQFAKAKTFIGEENIASVSSRQDLRDRLTGIKSGGIFLTTIQKFSEDLELLSDRENIICIADEAHRSQINLDQKTKISDSGVSIGFGFAKYLHDSLPNATYVGVTGTPVDGTLEVFGDVKDSYTLKDSVEDQITVPISYEGRAAKVSLNEEKLLEIEQFYERCSIEGSSPEQIEQSKRAAANLNSILGDKSRVDRVAKDFVDHYRTRISENLSVAGKAMFVCANRDIAWTFYQSVLEYAADWKPQNETEVSPVVKLVMTRSKDDEERLYNILGNSDHRKSLDLEFKDPDSAFKIAIVVDMWLTGFDVPELDVIYIDKPIQRHSLIQTISRVNRIYPNKEAGLVVDYIGLKKSLNEALSIYGDYSESSFTDVEQAYGLLVDSLEVMRAIFFDFDSTNYFSGSPLERLVTLNSAVEYCQLSQDTEDRFRTACKAAKSAFSLCSTFPKLTQREREESHFYFSIRAILSKITSGDALDTSRMNSVVQEMVSNALLSEGIEDVLRLDKSESNNILNIFDADDIEKIRELKAPNTKIKILEKLLRGAIREFRKTNLVKSVDFSKRLQDIVSSYNDRSQDSIVKSHVLDELAERLSQLFEDLRGEQARSDELGVTYEERAFFDILHSIAEKYSFEFSEDKLKNLAKRVKSVVDDKARYTDWAKKADIKAELRVDLILLLDEFGYPPVPKDEIFREIFEQAENFKRYSV